MITETPCPRDGVNHSLRFRKGFRITSSAGVSVRPDVVFTRSRTVVFVDGCYWHRCPDHGTVPRRNAEYWAPKLASNVARDRRVDEALQADGWQVVRVWEHQDPDAAAETIGRLVRQRSITRSTA